MAPKEVIFMKKGDGESSYVQNSLLTQKVNSITKPVLQMAVKTLLTNPRHLSGPLNVADLGCAAGPNTFSVMETISRTVAHKCKEMNCQMPELQFYLNDLLGNDFNTLFQGLAKMNFKENGIGCFVMGVPGSFHERLFPRNSLHLVYSSYSVHWLSQAPKGLTCIGEGYPLNKGKIYISKESPTGVKEAYLAQFQEDFTKFLESRSDEVVPNGCMVLLLNGSQSSDLTCRLSTYPWDVLAKAIAELVSQGLIDKEKLDTFNVPYHTPSLTHVQEIVKRQGSFEVTQEATFLVDYIPKHEYEAKAGAEKYAKCIRSFTESMIANQFGEEVVDNIYENFARVAAREWTMNDSIGRETIILVLSKIEQSDYGY